MEPRPQKLLDQVRDAIRLKHYSIRSEDSYVNWIRRYILFHSKRHPNKMGASEVEAFLTYLAVNENVAASTQNQALSVLLFPYREVLHKVGANGRFAPASLTRPDKEGILAQGAPPCAPTLVYGEQGQ